MSSRNQQIRAAISRTALTPACLQTTSKEMEQMLNEDLEKAETELEKAKKDKDRAIEEKGSLQVCEPQPPRSLGAACGLRPRCVRPW